ncbi:MAG: hypothetical protein E4H48_08505 [Syntrophobacterales bacterium]|nr:MAG: hypothetical protein E4H48_08505 [Syntrophobacterales bacterium]
MIARKKEFSLGLGLLAAFFVVLVLFFSPVFNGHNGLDYLDNLYNSISKGSAYYIPKLKEDAKAFNGSAVEMNVSMASPAQAQQTAQLFMKSGAMVNVSEAKLKVSGDLGKILENCLADSDALYKNDGKGLTAKYGYNERQALYNWWQAFKGVEKDLNNQKKFKEAKTVANISKKAVETCYNYYTIEPQSIMERLGVVVFSLVFYVIYTLWYGFAILFMFEGWGMKLEH